jgi:hypothetical protein
MNLLISINIIKKKLITKQNSKKINKNTCLIIDKKYKSDILTIKNTID